MIFVSPESRILAVDEDRTIGCLDTNSTPDAHVNWSTTATSANISTQMDFVTLIFRISELVLTEVDSGYCGQYTCTFTDSLSSATASITVGKLFQTG